VCLDPADFALAAVRDGNIRVGDAVAVFGLGAIGLMAVQVAKLSGAYPVIGVDPLANRREAGVVCGADSVLDPANCDAGLELKKATDRRGVDVAIEYSGAASAMQAALRGVAFGGTVVAGAFPPPYGAGLDFGAEAHLNRPNIVFSRAVSEPNRDHPRWSEDRIFDMCWRLFEQGMLTGEPVVTPVVDFEELVTEYPKIVSDPGSNIKLGCRFG
jgi:threonine dehydrogenase-like Zn-dependent dehydrogenase